LNEVRRVYGLIPIAACLLLTARMLFAQPAASTLAVADRALRAGRFAEAARQYEAWLRARPDSKEILFALGVCYLQLGKIEEAVATLRKYVSLVPRSASGHAARTLARIYLSEGEAEKAVTLLQPLVAADVEDETLALLGDALIRTGRARIAATLLERQLQTNSRCSARVYALAAWANLQIGDEVKAAEICERGMRLYPDSEIEAVYLALPAPFLAERTRARLERLRSSPEVVEMIALGRVLLDVDPARKTRAGDIAQQLLAYAVRLAPDNASARYNYGRALDQSDPRRALAEWEKALTLDPSDELRLRILLKIGATKLDLADFEGAERAFRSAVELDRKSLEAMLEYARFLRLRSRMAEAERILHEALVRHPLSPQARLEWAILLAARGQWRRVVEEGEFVLRNAGDDEELLRAAHALLARAYYRLNQPEKAEWHRSQIETR
jgi:tetratricopeptide (TPR) repeat protein